MVLDLKTFEQQIHALILDRGKDYLLKGWIEDLEATDDGWTAEVKSTVPYQVRLIGSDSFESWHCTCPFDHGPVCKHVAAVLYAIRELKNYEQEEIQMAIDYFEKLPEEKRAEFVHEAFAAMPELRQFFLKRHYKTISEEGPDRD